MKRLALILPLLLVTLTGSAPADETVLPQDRELAPVSLAPVNPAPASPAVSNAIGTCRIHCAGGGPFSVVSVFTTFSNCCSRTINPCPAGTFPALYAFNGAKCPP